MKYQWILKINGRKEACGWCDTKDDAMSEAGRYFMQYCEENFDKITLEIKRK